MTGSDRAVVEPVQADPSSAAVETAARADQAGMAITKARSQRPDRVTVWFVSDEKVGLDVRWVGRLSDRRATAAHERFRTAGHNVSIARDELGWRVRLCPLDHTIVGDVVSSLFLLG